MRVVGLRHGGGHVLHVFAGAGGSEDEVAALTAALPGDPTVVAHVPATGAAAVGSVAAMAAVAAAHVRATQPHGPYRLLGYSMGGLMALEVSEVLEDAGEDVEFVGMIDSFFDQACWPTSLFLRAAANRAAFHARSAMGRSPGEAAYELARRGWRLSKRVARRFGPGDPGPVAPSSGLSVQDANLVVLREWRPRTFERPVTLFAATTTDFGCDLAELWRPWLPALTVRRIDADHTGVLRSPASVALVAGEVERALAATPRPLRVLVATTFRWRSAARLAVGLHGVDCAVHAVAPVRSPVHDLSELERTHRLSLLAPLRSLEQAVVESRADLVVPFDDRTRQALEKVYDAADPTSARGATVRAVIERSLGSPEGYGRVYSRAALMELASAAGVRCPETAQVRSAAEAAAWFAQHGSGGAVLKVDGSWGGRGVAMVHSERAARRAWREMSGPPPVHRAVKRLLVERDPWSVRARLTGTRPVVTIQELVEGRPANAAVACISGATLGQVQAEVLESDGPTGPATVVRLVDNADVSFAAKSVVAGLGLSGLCGLDFVLDPSGRAYLLELNPRATPTAHLVGVGGSDPLTSLRAAFGPELPLPRPAPCAEGLDVSLVQPGRSLRGRTYFWLPSRRLPTGSTASGEAGGPTRVATTRGTA